jgi:peptide deformylase
MVPSGFIISSEGKIMPFFYPKTNDYFSKRLRFNFFNLNLDYSLRIHNKVMRRSTNVIRIIALVFIALAMVQCINKGISDDEQEMILSSGPTVPFRVLTIEQPDDSLFLRQKARPVRKNEIQKEVIKHLTARMLATVTDSTQDGVGIAATQIGVGVQVITIQRYDKEGYPFEHYFNPEIVEYSESINAGREGCLSVPGYWGNVERSQKITIAYLNMNGKKVSEEIEGFTAVIFQHEIDHLNGIFYFDRIPNGFEVLEKAE